MVDSESSTSLTSCSSFVSAGTQKSVVFPCAAFGTPCPPQDPAVTTTSTRADACLTRAHRRSRDLRLGRADCRREHHLHACRIRLYEFSFQHSPISVNSAHGGESRSDNSAARPKRHPHTKCLLTGRVVTVYEPCAYTPASTLRIPRAHQSCRSLASEHEVPYIGDVCTLYWGYSGIGESKLEAQVSFKHTKDAVATHSDAVTDVRDMNSRFRSQRYQARCRNNSKRRELAPAEVSGVHTSRKGFATKFSD